MARLRSTRYDLTITNDGDTAAELELAATDEAGSCRFSLPRRVSVAAGSATTLSMGVRPATRRWRGGQQTHRFTVSASGAGDGPPTSVSGDFSDLPYGWLPFGGVLSVGGVAAVVAAVLLLGGGVLSPTPETSRIVFTSDQLWRTSDRFLNFDIFVMNPDGSEVTALTFDPALDADPAWSPDHTRIAFHSHRDSADQSTGDVFVMNADGSGLVNLTNNPGADDDSPAWSPDGTRIAFHSDRDGNAEIYVMNADGADQTNITTNPADDAFVAW